MSLENKDYDDSEWVNPKRLTLEQEKATQEAQTQLEVNRHDEKIMQALAEGPIYKKRGEIKATIAQGGEAIVTKLADGTVETNNVAKAGDMIVTNPGGEQYVMTPEKFAQRYEPKIGANGQPQADVFSARGYSKIIDNPFNAPITMLASWGEMQNGAKDAKIADTYDPETKTLGGEPYIIGRNEFIQTYEPASEPETAAA